MPPYACQVIRLDFGRSDKYAGQRPRHSAGILPHFVGATTSRSRGLNTVRCGHGKLRCSRKSSERNAISENNPHKRGLATGCQPRSGFARESESLTDGPSADLRAFRRLAGALRLPPTDGASASDSGSKINAERGGFEPPVPLLVHSICSAVSGNRPEFAASCCPTLYSVAIAARKKRHEKCCFCGRCRILRR